MDIFSRNIFARVNLTLYPLQYYYHHSISLISMLITQCYTDSQLYATNL